MSEPALRPTSRASSRRASPRYPREVPDRILVYGVTGSGKTALAERISAATGIPWHSVDDLTWEPGWVPVPADEQRRRIEAICAGERWVLDTAYGAWLDIVLARAELIVALDFPRWRSLSRLVRRTLARALDGRTICNGNRESLRHVFSRDSIVVWHFQSFPRKRRRIRAWEADPGTPGVVRLTSPRDADRWLADRARRPAAAASTRGP
jgi:adenylate kinase family enzyme